MKRRNFLIGPGAASLLLVVVVVSMSVLGLLALMSARTDARLSARSSDYVQAQYEAMAKAERSLAQADAALVRCLQNAQDDAAYLAAVAQALPQNMTLEGRLIRWTEETGGPQLYCAAEIAPMGSFPRLFWTEHLFSAAAGEEW